MDVTVVWAVLLTSACVVLALVGLVAIAQRPARSRPDPRQLRADAEELTAHASNALAEADRAAAAAAEVRGRLAEAERIRDDAWAAQEAAARAYQEVWAEVLAGRAAAQTSGAGPITDAEHQRALSRAALTAYRNGDISVDQLRDVWWRAGDPDPELAERERTAFRYRQEECAARRGYDRAALAARQIEQEARVAEVAAQALADEAADAAVEADEAHSMIKASFK
ncbi:hypothetical protein WEI85_47030 [Actinomycetes bacterium KLBMP 9797]